jgi:hypothetical protein
MSTKTNFKRVALVAVATLGLGVLTSVAPANASTGDITFSATLATALPQTGQTTGVCSVGLGTAASPSYIAVGGVQEVVTAVDTSIVADWTLTLSGAAGWVGASSQTGGSKSSDNKSLVTITGTGTALTGAFTATGTGPIQLTIYTAAGVASASKYFIAVASCNNAWSASQSKAQLNLTAGASATSNVDATGAATISYTAAGQYSYLDIILKDAYAVDLVTTLTPKIATVTGGCTVNWDTGQTTGTTTAVDPAVALNATEDLIIIGDNTPRTCTVTVDFGGTVVASKSVKMHGDVATLTVDSSSTKIFAYGVDGSASATAIGAESVVYMAKDSAGNVINLSSAPTISSGTAGFQQATFADGETYPAASAVTNGFATLDFVGTSTTVRGAGTYKIKVSRLSDAVIVYSDAQSASINKSTYTYTASFDKASYVSGDIMTLTISAKDSAGNPVYDGYTIGTNTIGVGGTTALSTIATTDAFVNGVKKYKYSAGATASGYGWTVDITNGSLQDAIVGTVNITAPTTGVSNADVLKAIVSLIASINKQIAALQKALLKK